MLSGNEIKILLMLRNRSGNLFSGLSKGLIIKEIGGINARNAFECLINTDYEKLFYILKINPRVIFDKIKVININGEIIETTLLNHALYLLDSFALQLLHHACLTYLNTPSYLDTFKKCMHGKQRTVDLNDLFNAYSNYIEKFEQHKSGLISKELLLEDWLNVGKKQRDVLPRHMLRKMCVLPVSLQPASHDLIIISLFPCDVIDNKKLDGISKSGPKLPILIKQNNEFIFCKFDFFKKQWNRYKLTKLPFSHLDFPEKNNQSQYKPRDNDIKYSSEDYWPWSHKYDAKIEDGNFYMQEPMFFSPTDKRFEKLLPLNTSSQLGNEFTLARGSSAMCFAVANPLGNSGYLKYKAGDDLKSFQKLLQKEIEARASFISEVINLDLNDSDDVSRNNEIENGYIRASNFVI